MKGTRYQTHFRHWPIDIHLWILFLKTFRPISRKPFKMTHLYQTFIITTIYSAESGEFQELLFFQLPILTDYYSYLLPLNSRRKGMGLEK